MCVSDQRIKNFFFLFINKSPMSNLFSAAFNLVNDLFVLLCLLHIIESIIHLNN